MEREILWFKEIISHRLQVVHPGGVRPKVQINAHPPGAVAACEACDWRSSTNSATIEGSPKWFQGFVNDAKSVFITEKELLVYLVMES